MLNLTPFLLFDGNCAEAMAFYHSCLGGELTLTMLGDTPMKENTSHEHHDKVVYAHLKSRDIEFSATDWMHATRKPRQGNTVAMYVTDGAFSELREAFEKLSLGADRDLLDELQDMPFGTYGHLADRFGVHWFFRGERKIDIAHGSNAFSSSAADTTQDRLSRHIALDTPSMPVIVDRATFQAELDVLRVREKAHTHEGDAIAAARRRLPMVEVAGTTPLSGSNGPITLLDAFEGRRLLIAYYFMWHTGQPAAEQCEGCTWVTSQVTELSYLHSRDITFAVVCQGPYDESIRYHDFMGWEMPWYAAAQDSLETLLVGRHIGRMHLVCYLRDGDRVFETYWTTIRGAETMDYSYALMDLTAYGRQEAWEDSPAGWPRRGHLTRTDGGPPEWPRRSEWPGGRPTSQWSRLEAGRTDDLGAIGR